MSAGSCCCTSKSKLLNVEDAICKVIQQTLPLGEETLALSPNLCGRVLAESVLARAPVPAFPASIMDGYAVRAPLKRGVYRIRQRDVLAGDDHEFNLDNNQSAASVVYIATGAALPSDMNAVVKIEDTELVSETEVAINTDVEVENFVRTIGSDVALHEEVLAPHTTLAPTDIALLAMIGHVSVRVFARPVVGILSTGSELVDAAEVLPEGSTKVRDCNRLALLSAFMSEGYPVIDYGIARDDQELLREIFAKAMKECDVLVTSGGVSAGKADFVKLILADIATVHFSQLNMKPGKPTTFATCARSAGTSRSSPMLFFGLPGNPVSCLVAKQLFVDVSLRRLQSLPVPQSLHAQVKVQLTEPLTRDPQRVEYHRVRISSDARGDLIAHSTGFQRSSRLLSMRSANGLAVLPAGEGPIPSGQTLTALMVGPLPAALPQSSLHPVAARLFSESTAAPIASSDSPKNATDEGDWRVIRVGLLTVSDRASQGVYEDRSGPEIERCLRAMTALPGRGDSEPLPYPLRFEIMQRTIVPDDVQAIRSVVERWTQGEQRVDLLLSSGGTGFGLRDVTPEAVRPLLHREAPGVAQALLQEGLKHTPLAVLSRPVAGTRFTTLLATLPGSVKAVRENIVALQPLLPRIFELLKTDCCTA